MPGARHAGPAGPRDGWRDLARLVVAALPAYALADGPAGAAIAYSEASGTMRVGAGAPRLADVTEHTAAAGAGQSTTSGPEPSTAEHTPAEHAAVWRLVERAQAGDGEAFGELYDRYVDTVYRFIYVRVHDRALAEDFTSETFLRALRRITSVSYQGRDIGAWFITIARNIVYDHSKSARVRLESPTSEQLEPHDGAPSTESTVLARLTNERLIAAVNQLGDEQRECVLLRFIHGLSVSETASVMGKNDGAIKAMQHRAIRKLASLVEGELE